MTVYPTKFIIEEALKAYHLGKPGKFRAMLRLGVTQLESSSGALRRERPPRVSDYAGKDPAVAQGALQGSLGA